ncbi:Phosphoric monoester hydrolase [Sarracenia purpurea var. burkii]
MDRIDQIFRERVAALMNAMYSTRLMKDDNVPCKIEEGLYLGSFAAANNKTVLKNLNVTHILTVANSLAPAHRDDFIYKIIDGRKSLLSVFFACI